VSRYLHGALRDAAAAEELYQEFALRFMRGDFHRANPENGRFRDFVKTALLRLVSRHSAGQHSGPAPLEIDVTDPAPTVSQIAEESFLKNWRADLLARIWQALERSDEESGRNFYPVLRLRVEHPDLSSEAAASLLSSRLGKSVSAVSFRQSLHRARELFANLLLEEVAQSLEEPTTAEIAQELADLGLLEYCRPALAQREK
jgi:RNA polymerase sigma-70 factor (ECF subfamily)